jgi:hypothetical protein
MNRMTSLLLTHLTEQAIMTFIYLFMNLYGGWLIWTNTLLNFLFLILNILLHTGKNNSTRVFLHVIIGFLSYPQCQKVRSYLSASSSNWWMFWQLLVANLFWIMIGLGCGYWRTTKMGSGGWELIFFFLWNGRPSTSCRQHPHKRGVVFIKHCLSKNPASVLLSDTNRKSFRRAENGELPKMACWIIVLDSISWLAIRTVLVRRLQTLANNWSWWLSECLFHVLMKMLSSMLAACVIELNLSFFLMKDFKC